jgi:hypothetical protein
MANWPSSLPFPLLASNAGAAGLTMQRTDFSAGPARQRQTFTNAPETQGASWIFNTAQFSDFKSFWKNDIGGGANWFNANLDIGEGVEACEARFVEPYSYQKIGPAKYRVSADLEIRVP